MEKKKETLREILSPYFFKRKDRLKKEFIDRLELTAIAEDVYVDEYGGYKPGLFTYGSYVVEVHYEDGLWGLAIYPSEGGMKVSPLAVKECRNKFVPNDCLMCQVFSSREQQKMEEKCVRLFELPNANDNEEPLEETDNESEESC